MPEIFVDNNRNRKQLQYEVNENGCWICTSHCKDKDGYYQLRYNNKNNLAHRFVYEKYKNKIPKDMCVCHKCDNPACVNPEHLFLDTSIGNTRDRNYKKRQARGEKISNSVLTEKEVVEIKKSSSSLTELSKRYKIAISAIASIKNGITWKHIDVKIVKPKTVSNYHKYTYEQKIEIKNSKLSQRVISKKYGINAGNISKIKNGKLWKNIPYI